MTKWEQNFKIEFIFMFKYKLPWIFKWSYGKEDGLLFRSHSVKWCDKFAIDRVQKAMKNEFPSPAQIIAVAPKSTIIEAFTSSSKSKKELIELAHQLLKEAKCKSDDDEASEASSSTQVNKKEKKKWADYSDVDDQDPYDFSPLDLGSD